MAQRDDFVRTKRGLPKTEAEFVRVLARAQAMSFGCILNDADEAVDAEGKVCAWYMGYEKPAPDAFNIKWKLVKHLNYVQVECSIQI